MGLKGSYLGLLPLGQVRLFKRVQGLSKRFENRPWARRYNSSLFSFDRKPTLSHLFLATFRHSDFDMYLKSGSKWTYSLTNDTCMYHSQPRTNIANLNSTFYQTLISGFDYH